MSCYIRHSSEIDMRLPDSINRIKRTANYIMSMVAVLYRYSIHFLDFLFR